MKKSFGKFIITISAGFFILPMIAAAQGSLSGKIVDNLQGTGLGELGGSDLATTIGNIVAGILGFTGLIMILLIIYAGFLWGTAAGDDSKVKKAKNIITAAVIGLVIIFSAYAITSAIVNIVSPQSSVNPTT